MLEILQHAGADRGADYLLKRHRGRLVAHVGAVGQVVMAVKPREKLPEVGRFKACATRGVENYRLWVELLQFRPDARESLVPGRLDIAVGCGIVSHRVGQAAHFL